MRILSASVCVCVCDRDGYTSYSNSTDIFPRSVCVIDDSVELGHNRKKQQQLVDSLFFSFWGDCALLHTTSELRGRDGNYVIMERYRKGTLW